MKWEKLTHIDHVLKRPDSYVGSLQRDKDTYWIHEEQKFVSRELNISPALIKIIDEILVNAMDQSTVDDTLDRIDVTVKDGTIKVSNNGKGIPIVKHEKEGIWLPELIFGNLLTSSNYDDTEKRTTGGRNGYGAKLTNIYSKKFKITCKDPTNQLKYTQSWSDNMSKKTNPKITEYEGDTGLVEISFVPDWERFGYECMDEDLEKLIEKRVWDAAVCTDVKVRYQGKVIPAKSISHYAKMYTDEKIITLETSRWSVAIAPSRDKGFQHISWVNGICTNKGGTHVDHVTTMLTKEIHGALEKKNKNLKIRPFHLKNCLFIWVRSTLENPTFSSQTKSECTLKSQNFGSRFEVTPKFIKDIVNSGVGEEALAISKFQEARDLKKTDGSKKSRITGIPKLDDANWAGTTKSEQCTLIVTEGDSAKALAVAGLSIVGRNKYGVFPLRGKPLNVRDASAKVLANNQEFTDLKKIIGLQQNVEYTSLKQLRYGRLMIMTDADLDGSHIKGLVLNMIEFFWPSLLKLGFIVSMVTPIIKATKGKQVLSFYTDQAFKEWGSPKGWKVKYYKGLGTSTSKEAKEYFKEIETLTVGFLQDEKCKENILLAFDKINADNRKIWLRTHIKNATPEIPYGNIKNIGVSDFIHRDLVNFSIADVKRSIPHLMDGLKPSQRKILYACMKRNLISEIKVAQLAGYVSEKTAYHHGEQSLIGSIVNMAQTFVGSNNLNLLEPCGQFGTRLMGGKDAASARYIFTRLSSNARLICDPRDDAILNYLEDDGQQIEPEFYVPTLPLILVNGADGIGTGFSTNIPTFNPKDIKKNIALAIKGKPLVSMTPWVNGFTGTVTKKNESCWTFSGIYDNGIVSELPPGKWTQDYRETLDKLQVQGVIRSYENHSTEEKPNFIIKGYTKDSPLKDLKLTRDVRTSNMYLMTEQGIKKYNNAEEIVYEFVCNRKLWYDARKKHMILTLSKEVEYLTTKTRFVRDVVNKNIIVFGKKKTIVLDEMTQMGYKQKYHNDLMDIKTYMYTHEAAEELYTLAQNKQQYLDKINETNVIDMWVQDLLKIK